MIDLLQAEVNVKSTSMTICYFYCQDNTAEAERSDPEAILRSFLVQMALSMHGNGLKEHLFRLYRHESLKVGGHYPARLLIDETVPLILDFTANFPVTFVVDGLDESDGTQRYKLIMAFEKLIRESKSFVKVLIASRNDGDLISYLSSHPNIAIQPSDNEDDITIFVQRTLRHAIQQKRLIKGKVSKALEERIESTLIFDAQGMYVSPEGKIIKIGELC